MLVRSLDPDGDPMYGYAAGKRRLETLKNDTDGSGFYEQLKAAFRQFKSFIAPSVDIRVVRGGPRPADGEVERPLYVSDLHPDFRKYMREMLTELLNDVLDAQGQPTTCGAISTQLNNSIDTLNGAKVLLDVAQSEAEVSDWIDMFTKNWHQFCKDYENHYNATNPNDDINKRHKKAKSKALKAITNPNMKVIFKMVLDFEITISGSKTLQYIAAALGRVIGHFGSVVFLDYAFFKWVPLNEGLERAIRESIAQGGGQFLSDKFGDWANVRRLEKVEFKSKSYSPVDDQPSSANNV